MEYLFPRKKKPFLRRMRKGGRPRVDDRECLNAIFWSVRTGMSLRHLPPRFGHPRTAQRRLAQWRRWGILEKAWSRYLRQTGITERQEWRRALAGAKAYLRIEFQLVLEQEWPDDAPPDELIGWE
jgi:transposase